MTFRGLIIEKGRRSRIIKIFDSQLPKSNCESRTSENIKSWFWLGILLLFVALIVADLKFLLVAMFVVWLIVIIYFRSIKRFDKKQIDSNLPTVIERLVIAVSSGLDLYSAILLVVSQSIADPASSLFSEVVSAVQQGAKIDSAMNKLAHKYAGTYASHVFMSLAMAYQSGGDVVRQLQDISDSCNGHCRDRQEEEIASLPAKAVLPLLLIFAGLMLLLIVPAGVRVLQAMSGIKLH